MTCLLPGIERVASMNILGRYYSPCIIEKIAQTVYAIDTLKNHDLNGYLGSHS